MNRDKIGDGTVLLVDDEPNIEKISTAFETQRITESSSH